MVRTVIPFRSAPLDAEAEAFVAGRLQEEAGENVAVHEDQGQIADVWDALGQLDAADFQQDYARTGTRVGLSRRAWMVGGTLAAGVAVGGIFLWRQQPTIYETAIGERRTIRLPDGSKVTLNTATRIASHVHGSLRDVVLEQGEAFFDVVHQDGAAFNVFIHEARVHVTGTRFNVRRHAFFVDLDLLEGGVSVSRKSENNGRGQRLTAGQAVRFDRNGQPVAPLTLARAAYVEAWRQGRISFDRTPLLEAVAEMNRYSQVPIVLDEPELERLPVDGVFEAGDTRAFASALRDLRSVRVRRGEQAWHLASAKH